MNKQVIKLLSGTLMTLFCFCGLPSSADWQPYIWRVTIETEQIPRQLDYSGCTLKPIVEAHITYTKADGSSEDYPYETLWFSNGKAFGLERLGALDIGTGQSVGIKVIHKTYIADKNDFKAAANAILRVFLDIRVNRNSLQTVIVPDDSFAPITEELINEHFANFVAPLETPFQIAGAIFMQDQSHKQEQTMCYAPNSFGY